MRQRKDVEYGRDVPPRKVWADYRFETHEELVSSVTEMRLKDGIAPLREEAVPA